MCGGVFCATCTTRTTALLDTSNLSFHLPPRGHAVSEFSSPASPVADLRVCDSCHDTVHGIVVRPPLTDAVRPPRRSSPRAVPVSPASSLCSSLHTPPDGAPIASGSHPIIAPGAPVRRGSSSSQLGPAPAQDRQPRTRTGSCAGIASPRHSPRTRALLLPLGGKPLPLSEVAPELAAISYGELDAYPLRVPSAICTATGAGRWEPKPWVAPNVPRGKPGAPDFCSRPPNAEEIAEARRYANEVIVDGEFHIRFPGPPPKPAPPQFPVESTF
jgi:hypothetical protein